MFKRPPAGDQGDLERKPLSSLLVSQLESADTVGPWRFSPFARRGHREQDRLGHCIAGDRDAHPR